MITIVAASNGMLQFRKDILPMAQMLINQDEKLEQGVVATRLIQFAIGLSVLTFIVTHNVVSTLSVIVVAGACGFAVGTPIALLATNGKLSRRGVIVKGGLQIENLSSAGTIVFDKN
ncbi:MAG: hypothetical protein WA667_29800 [Candidatus Nitrosopolaris sp.]